MVCLPRIVGAGTLPTNPAMCCCFSYCSGSCLVVAFVVVAFVCPVCVDDCLGLGLAGWAAVACGGQLFAVEAGAGEGHGGGGGGGGVRNEEGGGIELLLVCAFVFYVWGQGIGHVCNYVTHTCPLIQPRFHFGVPESCPRFGVLGEGVSETVLCDCA